jgi:ribosomal subunit interface protein
MVVEFAARHFHAPDYIREYAEKEVQKFKKYNTRVTQCQIILEHEHNEYTVEINVSLPGGKFFAKAATKIMTKSIDQAVEKAAHQIQKHMDQLHNHR